MTSSTSFTSFGSGGRLGTRLAWTVGLSSLVVAVVIGTGLFWIDYRAALAQMQVNFDQITEREAKQLSHAAWNYDADQTQVALRSVLTYPHVTRADFIASRDSAVVSRGVAPAEPEIHDIAVNYLERSKAYAVGTLRVYVDRGRLRSTLLESYARRLASLIAVLTLVTLLTLLLFDRQVTRHLRKVSRFVNDLRAETLHDVLLINRSATGAEPDELDQLVAGIATMQASLQSNIRSLEASLASQKVAEETVRMLNVSLEAKVLARTQELQQSNAKAEQVLELTNSGYYERHISRNTIIVSERTQLLLGLAARASREYSLQTEVIPQIAQVSPELAQQVVERSRRLDLEQATKVLPDVAPEIVFPFKRPVDGRVIWLRLRDWDGAGHQSLGLRSGALQDVTEEMTARQALVGAREEADRANRAKGEFLANMSHEIRTPLNGLVGMIQMLERSGLDTRQNGFVQKLRYSADVLLGVINDILDFSKIESAQLTMERIPVDLRELLGNLIPLLKPRAEGKNIDILFEVAPKVPQWLMGDPLRLAQIISNLGSNAIKFTNEGRVAIRVFPVANDQDAVPDTCRIGFEVQDTGMGMSEQDIARLFQSFSQADTSISRRFGGTGLGLVICKRLVEMMGGAIGVRSQPGVGSTFAFEVLFGLAKADEVAAIASTTKQPAVRMASPLLGTRILVADDNSINRDVAGEMLRYAGADVAFAQDGREAIDCVNQANSCALPFDAVLMDVQMPEVDGFAATKELRRDGANRVLPIIAMTAHALAGDREQSLAAGMDDHLVKPVSYDALIDTLLRWIRAEPQEQAATRLQAPQVAVRSRTDLPKSDLIETAPALERINGNYAAYSRLLERYLLQSSDYDAQYRSAPDSAALAGLAHRVQGSASALGLMPLRALAAAHETRLRAGESLTDQDRSDMTRMLEQSHAAVVLLVAAINAQADETPIAPEQAQAQLDLSKLMEQVMEPLRRFGRPPSDQVAQLLLALKARNVNAKPLIEALAAFDFSAAAAYLETLSLTESI